MKDFERDKLRADILKQCENELKEIKNIRDENIRNSSMENLFNSYAKALATIGVSSWKSLIDIDDLSNL